MDISSRGKGARTGHSMNYGNDEQGCRVEKAPLHISSSAE